MSPEQLHHLRLIDAHLDTLLKRAAERTPGEWTLGDENNSHYEICIGDAVACIERQDRYGLHMAFSREEMRANGSFIIACAGRAERGWKFTQKRVRRLLAKTRVTANDLDEAEEILAEWPLESLKLP